MDNVIELTSNDAAIDAEDARRHYARALACGWNVVGFHPPGGNVERLRFTEMAYRAERAFAKWLGVEWRRDLNGFHNPDVCGVSVRYGSKPWYGLVIHDRDGSFPYVLVVPAAPDEHMRLRIAGWLSRKDAAAFRAAGVGRALPGNTNAWSIPQRNLRPMDEFIRPSDNMLAPRKMPHAPRRPR